MDTKSRDSEKGVGLVEDGAGESASESLPCGIPFTLRPSAVRIWL